MAAARGIVDYRTYDYSSEWRFREKLLIGSLYDETIKEAKKIRFEENGYLVSNAKIITAELIDTFQDSATGLVEAIVPWVFDRKTKTTDNKPVSRAFASKADKLIERYKELMGITDA